MLASVNNKSVGFTHSKYFWLSSAVVMLESLRMFAMWIEVGIL